MRISACYIVKDEAEELRRSLASVRAVVDEIIVVSTAGSSAVRDVCAAFSAEVHDFAWVNDFSLARNKALQYVTGNIVDDVMFYGRGAGALPTASAVMGDVISTAQHILNGSTGTGMIMTDTKRIPFYSSLKLQNSYYFRLDVDDVTGVLSQIASAFAEHEISICEVVQKRKAKGVAELVLITEMASRESILHVEKALQVLPCMRKVANVIRVM